MTNENGMNMFAIGLVIICILFGALGQISMKAGMTQLNKINSISELFNLKSAIEIITNKYVFFGLVLYTASAFLWLGALSTLDVSFMYPMLSFAYIVTAIFAFAFLGESISSFRWIGILLIVIGCFFIVRS